MVCHKQESQGRKEGDERKSIEREREREDIQEEGKGEEVEGSTATFCDNKQ